MKIGRNAPCWCGSGKKYKRCHAGLDARLEVYRREGAEIPPPSLLKSRDEIRAMRQSGLVNVAVLDHLAPYVVPGATTGELDRLAHAETLRLGAVPAPLGYEGYPKSICTSVNDEVCHGIPSDAVVLGEGDIVNVDASTLYEGWFSDSSRMFCVGAVSTEARQLVEVARRCVEEGIKAVKPWATLGDMAAAVHGCAKAAGYSVVREVGGHGIGRDFHEEPWVGYTGWAGSGMLLVPGLVFTIEPMVNAGGAAIVEDGNGWTLRTRDGGLSAQWEVTVAVTEEGCEVLAW